MFIALDGSIIEDPQPPRLVLKEMISLSVFCVALKHILHFLFF